MKYLEETVVEIEKIVYVDRPVEAPGIVSKGSEVQQSK